MHVPDGHRLVWGECRSSAGKTGLHTYPDFEVVGAVEPESGETTSASGELVVTQLRMFGTALLRWRTGDLVDRIETQPCPSCQRTVPRVLGVRRGALVPTLALRTGTRAVDLRAVASALSGRPDVQDWRLVAGRSSRDGADELVAHLSPAPGNDPVDVSVAVARDVRLAAGLLPTQLVVSESGLLPDGPGLTGRILI